jgi:hypothetical protein
LMIFIKKLKSLSSDGFSRISFKKSWNPSSELVGFLN